MAWQKHVPKGKSVADILPYRMMLSVEKEVKRPAGHVPGKRAPEKPEFSFDPLAKRLRDGALNIEQGRKNLYHKEIHQHADIFLRFLVLALNRLPVEGIPDRSGQLRHLRPVWAKYRDAHRADAKGERTVLWIKAESIEALAGALARNEQDLFLGNPIGEATESLRAVRLLREMDLLMFQKGMGAFDRQMKEWSAYSTQSGEYQIWCLLKTAEPAGHEKNRHLLGYS